MTGLRFRIVCTCRGCRDQGTFPSAAEALRQVAEICTATIDTRKAGTVAPVRRHRLAG